jgi:DNA-binding HxlR family transcriptional regulator
MEVATMSANKWAEIIASTQLSDPDIVPEGFKTSSALASELNIPARTLTQKLRLLMKSGKIEKKNFRINHEVRGLYSTPHYRIIKH